MNQPTTPSPQDPSTPPPSQPTIDHNTNNNPTIDFSPPSTPLPHKPLNPDDKKRVVVVGGGISGISTAYYLQRLGQDVLVVESLDDIAQSATKVAVPILQRYQAPLITFDLIEKRKSQYCPVRMFYRAQQYADNFTIKSMYKAYGFDMLKSLVDNQNLQKNCEKLTLLTQSNYSEALNLIKDEKIPMELSSGFLFIGDDKTAMRNHTINKRIWQMLYKDCDIFELKHDNANMLFPALQQDSVDLYGGLYTPSSLVFHPTIFSRFLQQRIIQNNGKSVEVSQNDSKKSKIHKFGQVDFMFNTKAAGFGLGNNNAITSLFLEHREVIPETDEDRLQWQLEQEEKMQEITQLHQAKLEKNGEDDGKDAPLPGPNAGELKDRPKQYRTVSTSEIGIDKVVLCNGYQAYQITENIVPQGPLLQIVPVRSLSFDLYDKTRARFANSVPSLFPTYPATFFPEDTEFARVQHEWEEKRRALGIDEKDVYGHGRLNPVSHPLLAPPKVEPLSTDEIDQKWVQNEPLNLHGVSAVEFAANGLVLVQDLHNPRHIHGYLGKDMAQLSENIDDRHMQSIMHVLETIRRIPEGALEAPDYALELQSRRNQSRRARGGRYLSMQPNSLALHTVGKDGLPVIGQTPYVPNLFFNTGHGTSPQNTAIIGAKIVANIITEPKFSEYNDVINQQLRIDHLMKFDTDDQNLDSEGKKALFITKPTKFDLDRLYNIRPKIAKQKKELTTEDGTLSEDELKSEYGGQKLDETTNNDVTNTADIIGITPSFLSNNISDFSPGRWALHQFTPIWFEDAAVSKKNKKQKEIEAIEKRAIKRQQIQQRLAERNQLIEQQKDQ